jgi:cytoskeleton protein RodZ
MDVGAALRASREARGLSIDAIARATRVQPRILAAIERNDVTAVPPRPFGRGFVRAYAREVGLDADRTAHDYFAQFAPPDRASTAALPLHGPPPTADRTWVRLLAVIAIVVGAAIPLTRDRREPADSQAVPAVGTTGAPAPSAAEATTTAGASGKTSSAGTRASRLTVELTATRPCWITATADGNRVLYKLVGAGGVEVVRADRALSIRVGDPGAIAWRINGRSAGSIGRAGEARTFHLTPESATNFGRDR